MPVVGLLYLGAAIAAELLRELVHILLTPGERPGRPVRRNCVVRSGLMWPIFNNVDSRIFEQWTNTPQQD